jgi:4-coumarate--CoA ligase
MPLPVFHASAFPGMHIGTLRRGVQTWLLRRFDLELWLATVQNKQVTEIALVPPMAIAILMSPVSKKYSLKNIRSASIGAAPLGLDAQMRLKALLSPEARVLQVWGMTECSCVGMRFSYPEDDTTASVGKLLPSLEGK